MMFDNLLWFPFMATGFGIMLLVGILLFAFWIWMLVDCAKREFRNMVEKIVWLIVVALIGWLGALVYFIAVRSSNPHGLANHK